MHCVYISVICSALSVMSQIGAFWYLWKFLYPLLITHYKLNEGLMSNEVKLFEGNKIRSVWDNEKEEWYFSVVDVVGALTDSPNPRDYWYRVKKRMSEEEKSELSTICRQLKLKAPDGKMRETDAAEWQKRHRRRAKNNL